jgi:lipoic acid synthetase
MAGRPPLDSHPPSSLGSKGSKSKPGWLKVKLPTGKAYQDLKSLLSEHKLNTVCESAACPNRGECWSQSTATFMILGNICTRSCGFCNIATGRPSELDLDEPRHIAMAVQKLGLRYAVITSVNRDELIDGGAFIWAETVKQVKELCPQVKVEVLIPDFCGNWQALDTVLSAGPDVLNHNVETVPRLYQIVRPQAKFERSLEVLRRAKARGFTTKSGLMVGLGEEDAEVIAVMKHLRTANCDIVTIGQYMQPTKEHLPVRRWVHPKTFEQFHRQGMAMGFKNVFAGPLVRSSYHAEEQQKILDRQRH